MSVLLSPYEYVWRIHHGDRMLIIIIDQPDWVHEAPTRSSSPSGSDSNERTCPHRSGITRHGSVSVPWFPSIQTPVSPSYLSIIGVPWLHEKLGHLWLSSPAQSNYPPLIDGQVDDGTDGDTLLAMRATHPAVWVAWEREHTNLGLQLQWIDRECASFFFFVLCGFIPLLFALFWVSRESRASTGASSPRWGSVSVLYWTVFAPQGQGRETERCNCATTLRLLLLPEMRRWFNLCY